MIHYGDDFEYASSRLRNTVVKFDDNPVYVVEISDSEVYGTVSNMWGGDEKQVHPKDLDLSPIPLGFVNWGRTAGFLSRMPTRYYKQGLCNNNVNWSLYAGQLYSKNTFRTMKQIFPKAIECLEGLVCGEIFRRGISNSFAIEANEDNFEQPLLRFCDDIVGHVSLSGDGKNINYILDDEFKFLNEVLEKEVNV